jgi:hypothetical protein
MVLMLVLLPFLQRGVIKLTILNILVSAIIYFGILAVSHEKRNATIGLALGLPWFILTWITLFVSSPPPILFVVSNGILILFYFFTAGVILSFVLRSQQVNDEVLYGSVSIYLLIGGAWGTIYSLLEAIQPGSFFIDPAYNIDGIVDVFDLLYYSFTTLTTLGYGDIIPVSTHARYLAVVEAIMGVMYLAIIISRLVGMFIARSLNRQ